MTLPISVIIRTLNEEKNIRDCIDCCILNNPIEIIIVDGDSQDKTVDIVNSYNDRKVKLIRSEKGLARQRDTGINACSEYSEFIAIVDADDRLEKNSLQKLYNDLVSQDADACQAIHDSYSTFSNHKMTYWEKAMLINLKVIRDLDEKAGDEILMVGRPALYRKSLLLEVVKDSSSKYTSAAEDSDLSYRLKQTGAYFTIGSGITYRKHLKTFKELKKRWISYGSGDAKFIQSHPERKKRVYWHLLINYPIIRAWFCAMHYSVLYVPFFVLQGWIRFYGLLKYNCFGIGKTDDYKSAQG